MKAAALLAILALAAAARAQSNAPPASTVRTVAPGSTISGPGGMLIQMQGGTVIMGGSVFQTGPTPAPESPAPEPASARLSADRPIVHPGESIQLRLIVTAPLADVQFPATLPAVPGLTFRTLMTGQWFVPSATGASSHAMRRYVVEIERPGVYEIPEFTLTVAGATVTVPATTLAVRAPVSVPADAPLPVSVELSDAPPFYVGQTIRARLAVTDPGDERLRHFFSLEHLGSGLIVRPRGTPFTDTARRDGLPVTRHNADAAVTFLLPGTSQLQLAARVLSGSNEQLNTGSLEPSLLPAQPIACPVLPLPPATNLPGFSGGIGAISVGTPTLSAASGRAGEPLRLSVAISSTHGTANLPPPVTPRLADWQIAHDPAASTPGRLAFTLIPRRAGLTNTPPIPCTVFDPTRREYVTHVIAALPVVIDAPSQSAPAAIPAASPARPHPAVTPEAEPALSAPASQAGAQLSSLAPAITQPMFWLAQLLAAAVLGALALRERSQRFHAAHPEVRVRRAALRALRAARRRVRRAVHRRDPSAFADATLRALQAGTAPWAPAEAPSLVWRDIARTLGPGAERLTPIAQWLDTQRYAPAGTAVPPEVLDLAPHAEAALLRLESRLRRALRPLRTALLLVLAVGAIPAQADTQRFDRARAALTAGRPLETVALLEHEPTAPGTLVNLGLAHWQLNDPGAAVLSWERAALADPFHPLPAQNLAFARRSAQLREPELNWYETVAGWLPRNLWPWLAAAGFWTFLALLVLPGVTRLRRRDWHQTAAALGATVFLLCVPALAGSWTRSRLAVVTTPDQLRLTPTRTGEPIIPLKPGDTIRTGRRRPPFIWVQADATTGGWLPESSVTPIHAARSTPIRPAPDAPSRPPEPIRAEAPRVDPP